MLTVAALAGSIIALSGCVQEQPPVSQKVLDYYKNPPAPRPDPDLVTIIGDSFTGGSNEGGNKAANWVARVQQTLDRANLDNEGVGGTGYASHVNNFGSRIARSIGPNTDLVVFFGSRNDVASDPASVGASASAAYAEVKRIAPGAKILVIGPAWSGGEVPEPMLEVRNAVRGAAVASGATFVDPIARGWFLTPETQVLIGADGVHPTDQGHAFLADAIGPYIRASIAEH
ncbi:UNVERIFIED_ORG: lysophospholipase L1-like esterase [Arthrobacter globiformis]|nr:lysophospholipase L1-like esterase [Arthrobacter globiformis]